MANKKVTESGGIDRGIWETVARQLPEEILPITGEVGGAALATMDTLTGDDGDDGWWDRYYKHQDDIDNARESAMEQNPYTSGAVTAVGIAGSMAVPVVGGISKLPKLAKYAKYLNKMAIDPKKAAAYMGLYGATGSDGDFKSAEGIQDVATEAAVGATLGYGFNKVPQAIGKKIATQKRLKRYNKYLGEKKQEVNDVVDAAKELAIRPNLPKKLPLMIPGAEDLSQEELKKVLKGFIK